MEYRMPIYWNIMNEYNQYQYVSSLLKDFYQYFLFSINCQFYKKYQVKVNKGIDLPIYIISILFLLVIIRDF